MSANELDMKNIMNKTNSLSRLSLGNVSRTFEYDQPCITFDLVVDGRHIGSSLEWLDAAGELVRVDPHLGVNFEILESARDLIGSEDVETHDVHNAVRQLLEEQLATRVS